MHERNRPGQISGQIRVWSATASSIDVCFFDHWSDIRERHRLALTRCGDWWTSGDACLPVGQLYALRADGPASPGGAARFSPDRLLLDPYARAIARLPDPHDPLGMVIDDSFDWQGDAAPTTAWKNTVIYEAHVKGLTALHPDVPARERGTFLGLASPHIIAHLRALGVTAVELLPIHAHADEPALTARGLTNYWGYNTLSFFAPDPRLATADSRHDPTAAVREFKQMVRELHRVGIEVILDVVYNHTAEGPLDGPTLSWRGLDPWNTYRWQDGTPTHYDDRSGCGNTLNLDHPAMRSLVVDSLHYWVEDMHVDGFRFDLASALDRRPSDADSFFRSLRTDPRLAGAKLIAEPWDATGDGYRLGEFPAGIAEWNGRYRDAARRFWRGDAGAAAELATRLGGSEDVFGAGDRRPHDSVNYITAHDGFTLVDLCTYCDKHNEANGEQNADGERQNFSSNAGIEGPTDDLAVLTARETRQRSLLMTLMLSLGVPMLSGGDEMGRTQRGNNNTYCQDNATSWTPWPGDAGLTAFVQQLARLRRRLPHFARERFLSRDDVTWLSATGAALEIADWQSADLRSFGMRRKATNEPDVLLLVNGDASPINWHLPADATWTIVLSASAIDSLDGDQLTLTAGCAVLLTAS